MADARNSARLIDRWAGSLLARYIRFVRRTSSNVEEMDAIVADSIRHHPCIVAMWYGEGAHYDFKRGKFSMKTGHFTQVVWRDTRQVGCGMSQCNGLDVWICQYSPPGNVEGQYRENVLPIGCK